MERNGVCARRGIRVEHSLTETAGSAVITVCDLKGGCVRVLRKYAEYCETHGDDS
jgi:hypothetical protein